MSRYSLKNININSYDMLLKYISDEDIMLFYFGIFTPNTKHRCPFYAESNPSFYVFYDEFQNLRWIRFGYFGDKPNNAVEFVMTKFNINFYKALNKCYTEIYLGKNRSEIDTVEQLRLITKPKYTLGMDLQRINFHSWELEFWHNYGIDQKTLHHWNIYPCSGVWFNGILWHKSIEGDPLYAYVHSLKEESITCYRPWPKKKKSARSQFRKLNIVGHVMGLDRLPKTGNILFITSSMKDILIFFLLGYYAIAPHSERNDMGESLIADLKSRFTHIYVAFDNDTTGVNTSIQLTTKYDLKYWNVPKHYLGCKDPSDLSKVKSLDDVKKCILSKFKRDNIL